MPTIPVLNNLSIALGVEVLFKPSPFRDSYTSIKKSRMEDVHQNSFCTKIKCQKSRFKRCVKDCFSDLHESQSRGHQKTKVKTCHANGNLISIPLYLKNEYFGTILIGPFQSDKETSLHINKEINQLLLSLPIIDESKSQAIINICHELRQNLLEIFLIKETNQENKTTHPKITSCLEFINHNLHNSISIKQISKHINLSPSRFMHLFKEEMGDSFTSFLIQKKIEQSKRYLIFTNFTNKKICDLLKFESPSYFGLQFKKQTGQTPMNFRKENQQEIDP